MWFVLLELIINLAELVSDTFDDCTDPRFSLFNLVLEYGLSPAHEFYELVHPEQSLLPFRQFMDGTYIKFIETLSLL